MELKSVVSEHVKIPASCEIDLYCFIGKNFKNATEGEIETTIGEYAVIRSHTVIYAGNKIGNNFQTGHHVVIRECNEIGNDVSIGTLSCIEHHIKIGNGVRIHSQVFIPEYSVLHDNCWIGPNVSFTNAKYPRSKNVKETLKGPTIKEYAKIGANSTVLPGITIGKHALVGSGAVVSRDVPDYAIVAGNPAKIIGDIRNIPEYDIHEEE